MAEISIDVATDGQAMLPMESMIRRVVLLAHQLSHGKIPLSTLVNEGMPSWKVN